MTRDIITLPAPLPRAELTSTLTELGVRRVRILAAVVADVYVIVDPDTGEVNHDRIAHEIADAVTYRATNLTETEPGDALVCVAERELPVQVEIALTSMCMASTPARVAELAEGFAGEVF